MEKILLVLIIILSIFIVETSKLKRAVIYLATISLFSSIIYLFYDSPNIAIAEAAIGCTMSTVIYLVALKKQRQFNVYVFQKIRRELLDEIESFCEKEGLLFYYMKYKPRDYQHIKHKHDYELLISGNQNRIMLYSQTENYKVEKLKKHLQNIMRKDLIIELVEDHDL